MLELLQFLSSYTILSQINCVEIFIKGFQISKASLVIKVLWPIVYLLGSID